MRWLSHDTLFRGHSFFLIVFLRLFSTWSSVCVNFSCRCIPLNFTKLIRVFFKETEKKIAFNLSIDPDWFTSLIVGWCAVRCSTVHRFVNEWQHSRASHDSLRKIKLPLRGISETWVHYLIAFFDSTTQNSVTCSHKNLSNAAEKRNIFGGGAKKNKSSFFPLKHRAFFAFTIGKNAAELMEINQTKKCDPRIGKSILRKITVTLKWIMFECMIPEDFPERSGRLVA